MICITGDIHGDISRFKAKELRRLRKNDALIICGDFGFIWNGSRKEKKILKRLGKKRYNVLFVEGCHENFDLLEEYEVEEWCGGKTRKISGRLRQLMRGQVYEIAGKRIFTFGGGHSDKDDWYPEEGKNWWKREAPNEQELAEGTENLLACGNRVDFIVTHEPPAMINEFINGQVEERSRISTYLDKIRESAAYERWFFGKLHLNKLVPPKYHGLFTAVIYADKTKIKKKKEKN